MLPDLRLALEIVEENVRVGRVVSTEMRNRLQNRTDCLAQERSWPIRNFPVHGD